MWLNVRKKNLVDHLGFYFFQGALLLTEVLKERDAQIDMKNSKLDADKIREEHLLRVQERVMPN